jgi:DNA-binding transcriptional LysR family regulator
MNIRQLETFIRITEHGSFAAAAKALFTTQSTVSARIRELEAYIGVDLFDRSGHRAHLTPRGLELLPYARQMVGIASEMNFRIGDRKAISGVLRIGVVGLVAYTWFPKLMDALRAKFPKVAFTIDVSLTRVLIDRLRAGDLDLAIVAGPVAEPNLESHSLGYDEFVWMASPRLKIPQRTLTPSDLQRWPVLSLSEESHHHPVIERWFHDNGATYRPAAACNNMTVIAGLTMAGLGVCLLPRLCYGKDVKAGRLRVLETRPKIPHVEFVALSKSNDRHPVISTITELATQASELAVPGVAPPAAAGMRVRKRRPSGMRPEYARRRVP